MCIVPAGRKTVTNVDFRTLQEKAPLTKSACSMEHVKIHRKSVSFSLAMEEGGTKKGIKEISEIL